MSIVVRKFDFDFLSGLLYFFRIFIEELGVNRQFQFYYSRQSPSVLVVSGTAYPSRVQWARYVGVVPNLWSLPYWASSGHTHEAPTFIFHQNHSLEGKR
jgi:hypothetical protein